MLLLVSALFAVLRFGFSPCSRAERRPLCRARECRFVGLLAVLARKVFTPCTGSLWFVLSAFTSGQRPPGLAVGTGARCASPSMRGVPWPFLLCFLWFLSLVYFPLFGVLAFCGSRFSSLFCVSKDTRCRFLPLLFVEVVSAALVVSCRV